MTEICIMEQERVKAHFICTQKISHLECNQKDIRVHQIAGNRVWFLKNLLGVAPIPPALSAVEGVTPTKPTTILFQRKQDSLIKSPRKIAFENVRKMISECLRLRQIGGNFWRFSLGAPPPRPNLWEGLVLCRPLRYILLTDFKILPPPP